VLALTNLHAATGPNLLINGDFSILPVDKASWYGWGATFHSPPDSLGSQQAPPPPRHFGGRFNVVSPGEELAYLRTIDSLE
jgi:hypothetical protein